MVTISQNMDANKLSLTPYVSPLGKAVWKPLVQDSDTESYSYYLPAAAADSSPPFASWKDLDRWFQELHPSNYKQDDTTWTETSYKGEELLRKTAWTVWDERCTCEYGYSDTWQPILQSEKMNQVIAEISNAVSNVVLGSSNDLPALNSCNLNYYPTGGGVGFHADDEFLFDGREQPVRIISLSLTAGSANNKGARRFQVRKKQLGEDGNTSNPNYTGHVQEIMLAHGDLMTMEGYFQKHYLHSVWPGDSKDYKNHPHTQGERINLTWRTIVKHLDGSDECRGKTCPLAAKSSKSRG